MNELIRTSVSPNLVEVELIDHGSTTFVLERLRPRDRSVFTIEQVNDLTRDLLPVVATPDIEAAPSYRYRIPVGYVRATESQDDDLQRQGARDLCDVISSIHRSQPIGKKSQTVSLPPWIQRFERHVLHQWHQTEQIFNAAQFTLPSGYREAALSVMDTWFADAQRDAAIIHGAPSLATTFVCPGRPTLVLLGEDVAIASPALDWAFLLAEVRELTTAGQLDILALSDVEHRIELSTSEVSPCIPEHRTVLHIIDYLECHGLQVVQAREQIKRLLDSIDWTAIT